MSCFSCNCPCLWIRRPSSYIEERYRSRTSSSYNYWLSSSTKCRYFLSIGCKYGDHCQFRHERPLKSKSRSPERRIRSRSRSAVRRYRSRSRGYERKQRSKSQSPKTSSKSKNEIGVTQR